MNADSTPSLAAANATFAGAPPGRAVNDCSTADGDGSGAASVLQDRMEESVTEEEFERERYEVEPPLRTREEVAYYRIFAEVLGEIRPGRTISRFATA